MADQAQSTNDQAPPPQAPPAEEPPAIEEIVTEDLIKDILADHSPDLSLVDFTAELGSQAGDNYMSIMYAVSINTKSKSTGALKTIHVMLKTVPRNAFRREMINDMAAFSKESKFYSEVLRDFVKFQEDKGIEENDLFRAFPVCYSSFCDGEKDYLALENLRFSGFRMANRLTGMDEAHCEVVIKNLAKFHAISFAMFEGDYDKILEKYPFLEEKMFRRPDEVPEMTKMFMSQTFKMQGDLLRKAGFETEAVRVEGIYDADFFGRLRKLVGAKVPHAVVGHGDCWTNNMLFAYDESTGKIKDLKFIDFQLSRACSRTIDLNYFLHSSPKMDILNNSEEHHLRIYHDEFTRFANKLGYSNDELTYENLVAELQHFRPYGITTGLMLAPMLSAEKEDVPDMEKLEIPKDGESMNDAAMEFFSSVLKSDMVLLKLKNFANVHIPKCPTVWTGPVENIQS